MFPDGFPGFALEHAALIETSLMLRMHSSPVHMERLPDDGPAVFPCYDRYPQDGKSVPPSGVLSSAKGGDAKKRGVIFETVCNALSTAVTGEFE
jgi:creatinine amidohydrolase